MPALIAGLFALSCLGQVSTTVTLGPVLHTGVKNFGINLSGQTFYDSGQMLRNLVSRNPGFEGETWQSIVQCKTAGSSSCTTADQYCTWPAGFLANATFEIISGPLVGGTGNVVTNSAINAAGTGTGPTLTFAAGSSQPKQGDFLVLHLSIPGHADAGWWVNTHGGSVSTEFHDLPPDTAGKQALRINAPDASQSVDVNSYFDTLSGHSFVQMHGTYRLSFRAKQAAGMQPLSVSFRRMDTTHGNHIFLSKIVPLTSSWQNVSFDFATDELVSAQGPLNLTFSVGHASILLDDVFLGQAAMAAGNPTAFRDEVVQTLRDLKPGVLRYMDNGTTFGSSIDNMIAPVYGRQRAGYSTQQVSQEDIPLGLPEFLGLCAAVGAEPWYAMPAGISANEMRSLIEYLRGGAGTPYGARRAAQGQAAPWTSVFPVIHLELGNELWNYGTFAGATINDATAYGGRATQIFTAARSSPGFRAANFDLILGSWSGVPWWTQQEVKASSAHDSVAIAPYLFDNFNDSSSTEAIFGPMFAQPEALDSRATGNVLQQAASVRGTSRPAKLVVYETNLGTMTGSVGQPALDSTLPSLGAGLAAVDHMLLALRDAGVAVQCLFALPEYANSFSEPGGAHESAALWGSVVDMGGATNRRRPVFLAAELANRAVLRNMLSTTLSGANPMWNQALSRNDSIQLTGAHMIQTFAFADESRRSLILLNLSRTDSLPVTFAGPGAPAGSVTKTVLTSRNITDSNESEATVAISPAAVSVFRPATVLALPPYSMTTLTWQLSQ